MLWRRGPEHARHLRASNEGCRCVGCIEGAQLRAVEEFSPEVRTAIVQTAHHHQLNTEWFNSAASTALFSRGLPDGRCRQARSAISNPNFGSNGSLSTTATSRPFPQKRAGEDRRYLHPCPVEPDRLRIPKRNFYWPASPADIVGAIGPWCRWAPIPG